MMTDFLSHLEEAVGLDLDTISAHFENNKNKLAKIASRQTAIKINGQQAWLIRDDAERNIAIRIY